MQIITVEDEEFTALLHGWKSGIARHGHQLQIVCGTAYYLLALNNVLGEKVLIKPAETTDEAARLILERFAAEEEA